MTSKKTTAAPETRHEDDGIQRRDFLNGLLLAAGGLSVSTSFPALGFGASQTNSDNCGDIDAEDTRFLRGGNLPPTFEVAHWLRDGRLNIQSDSVTLSPGCDKWLGEFPLVAAPQHYDVIVVGGGLSGLSSAFYVLRRRPDFKVLLLEANPRVGGNAAYDEGAPLPVRAATCAAYMAAPGDDYLVELFEATAIDWKNHLIDTPIESYFIDDQLSGFLPSKKMGWQRELLGDAASLTQAPLDPKLLADIVKCQKAITGWAYKKGRPDEPPDASDPHYDYLSRLSFADYLTKTLGCDPRVVDFYGVYTVDCLGGTPHYVSAYAAISFLSAGAGDESHFAFPGGTAEVAIKLNDWLLRTNERQPSSFTVQTQAVALKVDQDSTQARVVYFANDQFHQVTGSSVIIAAQVQAARRLVDHLLDDERRSAWSEFNSVPALVANVAIKDMSAFHQMGLGYASFWWGSKYWSNFIIADWTTEQHLEPQRASVLTFYGSVTVPPEEFSNERMRLLTTPFSAYEASLREDLSRVMQGSSFDFDRDVSAIFLYRWGHSMILPTTKSIFGDVVKLDGSLDRSKAPRRIACAKLGRISFAGQYVEGTPSAESAISSGHRAALEALSNL